MRIIPILILCCCGLASHAVNTADSSYVSALHKKAIDQNRNNDVVGCITSMKEALTLARKIPLSNEYINRKLVSYLANRYSNLGDFERAMELNLVLLAYYQEHRNYQKIVWTLNNLGVYTNNMGKFQEAKSYFSKGFTYLVYYKSNIDEIDLLDGITTASLELGELKQSAIYLKKSQKLLDASTSPEKAYQLTYFFFSKAVLAQKNSDNRSARHYYTLAHQNAVKLGERKQVNAALELMQLAEEDGNSSKSLSYFNSIAAFYNLKSNPRTKDPYLVQAYFLYAKQLATAKEYHKALEYVNLAEEQAVFFHSKYVFNESKFFLDDIRRQNLELGVVVCFQLLQTTNDKQFAKRALLFADRAKYNVLAERAAQAKKISAMQVPVALKEFRFQVIHQLGQFETEGKTKQVIAYRNTLDSLNQVMGLTSITNAFDLHLFQHNLPQRTLILEYFMVNDICYRFCIGKSSLSLENIGRIKSDDIRLLYQNIADRNASIDSFSSLAFTLYKQLVGSISDHRDTDVLVIIPDKFLTALPFEVLLTSANSKQKWGDLPYLIKQKTITYGFSLQSLAYSKKGKKSSSYVGFAPDFGSRGDLAYLKHGNDVTQYAQSCLGGLVFLKEKASSQNFIRFGADAGVLHLYSHGVASDSSYDASYIFLNDRKMYVDEIMQLPLNNKLCILTACEVGLGKTYSGEGMTSVAWAFKAAGAENVIQSLWKLNERASSTIMQSFMDFVSDGQSSVAALQRSKLDYLHDKTVSARLKHPYYWAGMSHYGMGSAVSTQISYWWYSFGFMGFALILFLFIKHKKASL